MKTENSKKTRKTRFLRDPNATNRFLGVLNAKMTWNDLQWPKMTSKEARKVIFRLDAFSLYITKPPFHDRQPPVIRKWKRESTQRESTQNQLGILSKSPKITYNHLQSPTTTYDQLRSRTITYDHVRSRTITYDHVRSRTITYDHLRSPTITYDHLRSP